MKTYIHYIYQAVEVNHMDYSKGNYTDMAFVSRSSPHHTRVMASLNNKRLIDVL